MRSFRHSTALGGAATVVTAVTAAVLASPGAAGLAAANQSNSAASTPIKHLVVIFQENVSFDHYFGTYPHAANTSGQQFTAKPDTPSVNGLTTQLLTANPNGVNPRRYDPSSVADLLTCDQDHNYNDEQRAFDGGKMDEFPQTVGTGPSSTSPEGAPCNANDVMNYYDGNTVTGLWNYAQRYVAMSGKNIGDLLNEAGLSWGWFQGGFDPSTPYAAAAAAVGHAGQPTSTFIPDEFSGKFNDTSKHQSNQGICNSTTPVGTGLPGAMKGTGQYGYKDNYIPHHEPFQYYASTANPHHLTLATDSTGADTVKALKTIGTDTQSYKKGVPQFDTPNHNYDVSDFDQLVGAIDDGMISNNYLPAVSFLKAPGFQDGHAGYSDPIDEQEFLVNEINALEQTPDWKNTAVVISYDDLDGWYDHAYGGVVNPSDTVADALTGSEMCGTGAALGGEQGRCGYGPRLPLLVISPWAKQNSVDHTLTDQSGIIRFVETNWGLPHIAGGFDQAAGSLANMFDFDNHGAPNAAQLLLDPLTGRPQ